jgi:hypothetical protein
MSSSVHRSPSPRNRSFGGRFGGTSWILSVAAVLATLMLSPDAEAAKPAVSVPDASGPDASGPDESADSADPTHNLGRTIFGMPRMSWTMAPPLLQLQPEAARLMLLLPPEWMPAPDFGLRGVPFDPNKHWEFHRDTRMTRATLGTSVHLQITNSSRSFDFGLSLLPRAALATFSFDPLAGAK